MDRFGLIKKYESTVYLLLFLGSVVLAFVGHYLIPKDAETIKSIAINLASELLAVAMIFFIVNRLFQLDDSSSDQNSVSAVLTNLASLSAKVTTLEEKEAKIEQSLNLLIERLEKVSSLSEQLAKNTEGIKNYDNLKEMKETIQMEKTIESLVRCVSSLDSQFARLFSDRNGGLLSGDSNINSPRYFQDNRDATSISQDISNR